MTKREEWERIKRVAPDLAKLLQEVQRVFGKPESVTVRFK